MAGSDDVPRLPRGRGFKLSGGDVLRIAMTVTLLIAVVMLARPCGDAAGRFVGSFDPDAGTGASAGLDAAAAPALPPGDYVPLRADMTEDELRAAIEGSRERAAVGQGADAGPPDASPPLDAAPR